jgi:hypothetical protein
MHRDHAAPGPRRTEQRRRDGRGPRRRRGAERGRSEQRADEFAPRLDPPRVHGSPFARNGAGATGNPADNTVANAGAVYVHLRGATGWTQQAYLSASSTGADALLGQRLALSQDGNTLAVGAPLGDGTLPAVGAPPEDRAATGYGGDAPNASASDAGSVFRY